jgi:DNA helicase HerA-like ATPase
MWESTPLFQLAVGMQPRPRFDEHELSSALTLIEFDVDLNLPSQVKEVYSDAERISLAAIRCVTTASVGILSLSDGGVMATDEAHTVLGHADTVQLNSKMMREGRSLNVGLIYASQLPSDVLSKGMETYISRVFAMALEDDAEAAAAIKLVGFEVTDERIRMLRDAGPRRRTADFPGRAAVSLHRDLGGRRSAVLHDPIPDRVFRAFSTNVDDRRARSAEPKAPVPA